MCCSERLFLCCRQRAVMYLFDVKYTVRAEFTARLPENTIVLSWDIHLCQLLYLLHTFAGDIVGASEHLPPSVSILFSLFFQSLLSSVFLLPALPYISFHFPREHHLLHADANMRFLSLHPSLPLSLSPRLSLFPSAAL